MKELNQELYESAKIVDEYSNQLDLQKPEYVIFDLLKHKINQMKMLDIGIGGGRTTKHFASVVQEYLGVDYSKPMIEACKRKFPENDNIRFKVADVRDLRFLKTNSFDLVLFSFNGLDCIINYDDRIKALVEIKRVLKESGIFIFSTHNLYNLKQLYSLKICKNPIFYAKRVLKLSKLVVNNGIPATFRKADWAIINDA